MPKVPKAALEVKEGFGSATISPSLKGVFKLLREGLAKKSRLDSVKALITLTRLLSLSVEDMAIPYIYTEATLLYSLRHSLKVRLCHIIYYCFSLYFPWQLLMICLFFTSFLLCGLSYLLPLATVRSCNQGHLGKHIIRYIQGNTGSYKHSSNQTGPGEYELGGDLKVERGLGKAWYRGQSWGRGFRAGQLEAGVGNLSEEVSC